MHMLLLAILSTIVSLDSQVVQLVVRDAETRQPVPLVEARIQRTDGARAPFIVVGSERGVVSFEVEPGASLDVELTAIGYEEWSFTISGPAPVEPVSVWLVPRPIEIAGVSAGVSRVERLLDLRGFYDRERRGVGTFLEIDDRDRVRVSEASDYLRALPGIRIDRAREPFFTRGTTGFKGMCWPLLVLNGFVVREANQSYLRFDDVVPATDIAAIELFPGGTGAPPQFAGTGSGCGLIMIWTRGQ